MELFKLLYATPKIDYCWSKQGKLIKDNLNRMDRLNFWKSDSQAKNRLKNRYGSNCTDRKNCYLHTFECMSSDKAWNSRESRFESSKLKSFLSLNHFIFGRLQSFLMVILSQSLILLISIKSVLNRLPQYTPNYWCLTKNLPLISKISIPQKLYFIHVASCMCLN